MIVNPSFNIGTKLLTKATHKLIAELNLEQLQQTLALATRNQHMIADVFKAQEWMQAAIDELRALLNQDY